MASDDVPWLVNGGNVDAAVARAAHYAATNGAQGITRAGDLKVTATATASQSLQAATGSATILNQQAPGQSYQALFSTVHTVDINVTGSARTDLVIARIIDPDFSPWTEADVPDLVNGPYRELHVIEGVSAGTTKASDVVSYSAIALARVAVPASGNITNGMITDLRRLAQPRASSDMQVLVGPSPDEQLTTSDTAWKNWPSTSAQVEIPEWATDAQVSVTLSSMLVSNADVNINFRISLGGVTGATTFLDYNYTGTGGNAEVVPITVYADLDVTGLAGETVPLRVQAERTFTDTATGLALLGAGAQVIFDSRFAEKVS